MLTDEKHLKQPLFEKHCIGRWRTMENSNMIKIKHDDLWPCTVAFLPNSAPFAVSASKMLIFVNDKRVIAFFRQLDREARTYLQDTSFEWRYYEDCVREFRGRVMLKINVGAPNLKVWKTCGDTVFASSVKSIAKRTRLSVTVRPIQMWCGHAMAGISLVAQEIMLAQS
jgi:hypothetical protein